MWLSLLLTPFRRGHRHWRLSGGARCPMPVGGREGWHACDGRLHLPWRLRVEARGFTVHGGMFGVISRSVARWPHKPVHVWHQQEQRTRKPDG
jgi:hypothetical protein